MGLHGQNSMAKTEQADVSLGKEPSGTQKYTASRKGRNDPFLKP